MKDRLVSAARAKARELQEAAKPGTAAPELEEALDAAEGKQRLADTTAGDPAGDNTEATADGSALRAESDDDADRDDDGDGPVVAAS
jgi:1-acyl-sn-glycerol-3-phosphate acyltransferase